MRDEPQEEGVPPRVCAWCERELEEGEVLLEAPGFEWEEPEWICESCYDRVMEQLGDQ